MGKRGQRSGKSKQEKETAAWHDHYPCSSLFIEVEQLKKWNTSRIDLSLIGDCLCTNFSESSLCHPLQSIISDSDLVQNVHHILLHILWLIHYFISYPIEPSQFFQILT